MALFDQPISSITSFVIEYKRAWRQEHSQYGSSFCAASPGRVPGAAVTLLLMNNCWDVSSSSQKWGSESHDLTHLRPLKKHHLFDKDDKDWLKCEIDDVRDCMMQIADHLRGKSGFKVGQDFAQSLLIISNLTFFFVLDLSSPLYILFLSTVFCSGHCPMLPPLLPMNPSQTLFQTSTSPSSWFFNDGD